MGLAKTIFIKVAKPNQLKKVGQNFANLHFFFLIFPQQPLKIVLPYGS